jgi:hypothetical protein
VPPYFESPHALIEPSAMAQSRRGVVYMMEAQAHPLIMAIPRFIQLSIPLPPGKFGALRNPPKLLKALE